MKITRISFKVSEFRKLPLDEQLFFVRLGHAYNDLRNIQHTVVRAAGATRRLSGVEQEIANHQMMHGLRQWYATLNEAWEVVRSDWTTLGVRFYQKLTTGKQAYDFLKRYFSHANLVNTIRDRLAYHYDVNHLDSILGELPIDAEQHFVATGCRANIFYNATETIHGFVLIKTAGEALGFAEETSWTEEVVRKAVAKLYDEVCNISETFDDFCNDILPLIVKRCALQATTVTPTAVCDPESAEPIIFVDEDAVSRRAGLQRSGSLD